MKCLTTVIATVILFVSFTANADSPSWYIKPTFGFSSLSDQKGQVTDVLDQTGNVDFNVASGFNAGLGAGYFVDENWALELYWEYRSNDSDTVLPGGLEFTEGNFASNMFAANAYYYAKESSGWRWFAGTGIAIIQEIDIDLEDNNGERSFSGSGDIGFQIFTGIDYQLTQNWLAQAELRYLNISGIEMDAEENVTLGVFENIDYTPMSLQFNLIYKF